MGRPAVVPPAGKGSGLDARPCRGAGGERVGRFLRKRRGHVWPARRSSPTLGTLREVGMDRDDSILTGRWAAPGAAKAGSGSR